MSLKIKDIQPSKKYNKYGTKIEKLKNTKTT